MSFYQKAKKTKRQKTKDALYGFCYLKNLTDFLILTAC